VSIAAGGGVTGNMDGSINTTTNFTDSTKSILGLLSNPQFIAIDSTGTYLYVVDKNNHKISLLRLFRYYTP
jgi:DNA-binding beta-propeller fold protein YncE